MPASNTSAEKLLAAQVLSGNRQAFEKLVQQYEGLVLHIVTPLIGVNEDREDICQEVFIKVYENLGRFEFRSKLSTWIGNIAYNHSINFLQKKRHVLLQDMFAEKQTAGENENLLQELEQEESSPGPEELVINKEDVVALVRAIDTLPPVQRTVLLLFHQDELSLEEINAVLEMPVNTIKSHLFRARKSLRETLSK